MITVCDRDFVFDTSWSYTRYSVKDGEVTSQDLSKPEGSSAWCRMLLEEDLPEEIADVELKKRKKRNRELLLKINKLEIKWRKHLDRDAEKAVELEHLMCKEWSRNG